MEYAELKPRRQITEEAGPSAPAYLVTFSDMVTLLLTFFVMLLSLADVQDPELFNKGRDAFLESLVYIGLGPLFGKEQKPHLGASKTKYFVPEPDKSADRRTIDARAEELRRILERLKPFTTIVPSKIMGKGTHYSVTNVRFRSGRADLNDSAAKFLTAFCRDLQQDTDVKPVDLYVLGLASDGQNDRDKWLLSAKRAQAAADFMKHTLSTPSGPDGPHSFFRHPSKWTVYSLGVGPGGDWAGPDSPISQQSQILIGVLRKGG
jgi:outer membrane protein OmpA-like peptidoglycan-associated protein